MSSLGAFSMWDLFRGEVESQMQVLTQGLLAIESGAAPQEHLASTMRAAHSIKGAARIVQLDLGVRLAHAMEDCLVAAQEGSLLLNTAGIDVLLSAGDLLANLSSVDEASVPQWIDDQGGTIEEVIARLGQVRSGTWNGKPAAPAAVAPPSPAAAPPPAAPTVAAAPPPTPPAASAGSAAGVEKPTAPAPTGEVQDRTLKVRARALNRLVALTGESLVHSRRMERISESLFTLKRRQIEFGELLDLLQVQLENASVDTADVMNAMRNKLEVLRQATTDSHLQLEAFAIRSSRLSDRLYREALATRMRPFGDGVEGFPRLVRDLARQLGKQVQLEILGKPTEVDREILDRLEAPLNHTIRNSIDHGIETSRGADRRRQAGFRHDAHRSAPSRGSFRSHQFPTTGAAWISKACA